MKKISLTLFMMMVITFATFSHAFADDSTVTLGENGVPSAQLITANCHEVQSLIAQIRRVDSVTRVNRGADYNKTLDLFFAMNARLSSNNIAAPRLAEIVDDFQNESDDFRNMYNSYDDSLNVLLSKNCISDPEGFYKSLLSSRALSIELNKITLNMKDLVTEYRAEFTKVLSENLIETENINETK